MIDFHSHFLPGIDDGADNVSVSMAMLEACVSQGIDNVVATPHFYANTDTPEKFLAERNEAFEQLKEAIFAKAQDYHTKLPGVKLGAEVTFFDGISHYEGLHELCIEGTDLLLLEMPFRVWSSRMLDEVARIRSTTGIMPVAAHIERYFDQPMIKDFLDLDILHQSNAHFIYNKKTSRKACSYLKNNTITFIGTDAHNMDSRPVNMGLALQTISKSLGEKFVADLTQRQYEILEEYSGDNSF